MQSLSNLSAKATSKVLGDQAEQAALDALLRLGLRLLARNYKTPGRGGGEIDLIMQEPNGTVVFVEVRLRRSEQYGGALASVGSQKQRRLVLAASHFLQAWPSLPPCRFDVIGMACTSDERRLSDAEKMVWSKGAFAAF